MKNKLPDYVIEELIPRFRGIDTPTIAHVECKFLNMNRHFIMSKTSKPDRDELHFNIDGAMFSTYDITLCSDKLYRETKDSYEQYRSGKYDEVDGMLTTYRHSIAGVTYVTLDGFEKHFKIRALRPDFGIDIKPIYKFDTLKFKVNDVFKITSGKGINDIQYGILTMIKEDELNFKMPSNNPLSNNQSEEYVCDIRWIIDRSVKLERVEL